MFVKPRYGLPGILLGLMFATKESVAISLIAWGVAAVLLAVGSRRAIDRAGLVAAWREWRVPVAVSVVTALVVSLVFYTDWFRHPGGAVDALRTFFVYQTTEGHEKSFGYYFELLLLAAATGRLVVVGGDGAAVRGAGVRRLVRARRGGWEVAAGGALPRLLGGRAFSRLQPDLLQDAVAGGASLGACLSVSRVRGGGVFAVEVAAAGGGGRARRMFAGLA